MEEIALTPVSYLVLGEIARRGSATPYDLKVGVAGSVGHFWSFPHAQLYKEPPRLAAAGLLEEEREEGGRRRRVFRITEAGRRRFEQWLARSDAGRTELRDPGLLRLAFGDLAQPQDVTRLAREQADAHRVQLAVYQRLAALPPREIVWSLRQTLELGLAYEKLAVDFWDGVANDPRIVARSHDPAPDRTDPPTAGSSTAPPSATPARRGRRKAAGGSAGGAAATPGA
ncbi:helix-turn-helix transcriptional regulator [Frankia sp. Ag45/Mut15]|uniref:Helix-turn-helix transcriptional regulator n=1 Tax=Frankia umida TaxID=573489 RepID=A0ABT0K0G7_9ACTN|nr:helix-turn-helix transcriptional regulator [Frankia umida]MCK9877195.1 helix-turn-helix transcriptional regulator [Frankia umida]